MFHKFKIRMENGSAAEAYLDLDYSFEITPARDRTGQIILGCTTIFLAVFGAIRAYNVQMGFEETAKLVSSNKHGTILTH